jgi:hypothetical protein
MGFRNKITTWRTQLHGFGGELYIVLRLLESPATAEMLLLLKEIGHV